MFTIIGARILSLVTICLFCRMQIDMKGYVDENINRLVG